MKNNKMTFILNLFGILAMTLFGFCKKDGNKIEEQTSQSPYKVSGIVKNTKNQPIGNAKVRAVNPVLFDSSADVFTSGDGKYLTPKLDLGGWNIYAWTDIEYEGLTYHLRVAPEDGDYNAFSIQKEGKVKNFKLQLTGRINDIPLSENSPTAGYYGGTLLFTNLPGEGANPIPAGTQIKIILTPVAGSNYIDGSTAQVLEKTFTIQQGQSSYFVKDIPQCKYGITAKAGNKSVLLTDYRDVWNNTPYKPFLIYFFKPEPQSGYNSGLKSNIETPFYMELV